LLQLLRYGVGIDDEGPFLGEHGTHRRLARSDATRQPDHQHGCERKPYPPDQQISRTLATSKFALALMKPDARGTPTDVVFTA
jgi:hypothetical protein